MVASSYTILSIDSTRGCLSIALQRGEQLLLENKEGWQGKQAEQLLLEIEKILGRASLSYADLTAVAVCVGPGSFTGIRIGVATARGIGLAANIPVIGVTAFESMAYQANQLLEKKECVNNSECEYFTVIIDAKRDQLYMQELKRNDILDRTRPAKLTSFSEYEQSMAHMPHPSFIIAGEGLMEQIGVVGSHIWLDQTNFLSEAKSIGQIGMVWCDLSNSKGRELPDSLPLYIRDPDAKLPK